MSIYIVFFSLFLSIMVHASEEKTKITWWKRVFCCAWQNSANEPDHSTQAGAVPDKPASSAYNPRGLQLEKFKVSEIPAEDNPTPLPRLQTLGELAITHDLDLTPTQYYQVAQELLDVYKRLGTLTVSLKKAVDDKNPYSTGGLLSAIEINRICSGMRSSLRQDLKKCSDDEVQKKNEIKRVIDDLSVRQKLVLYYIGLLDEMIEEQEQAKQEALGAKGAKGDS